MKVFSHDVSSRASLEKLQTQQLGNSAENSHVSRNAPSARYVLISIRTWFLSP